MMYSRLSLASMDGALTFILEHQYLHMYTFTAASNHSHGYLTWHESIGSLNIVDTISSLTLSDKVDSVIN